MNIRLDPMPAADPIATMAGKSGRKPIALGFLCPHNPYDRTAFSGTASFAARALAAHPGLRLRILGPHRRRRLTDRLLRRQGETPMPGRLDLDGLDAVLGLAATPLLDGLAGRTRVPLLHVTDATPSFLRNEYGWDIPRAADAAEARVIANAASVIYSSQFMARQAQIEFGIDARPEVVPFGVNFEDTPQTCPEKPKGRIELLLICTDWARKGGDKALAILRDLNAKGVAAHLTVVGRMPDHLADNADVTFAGFLDKNRPRAAARLAQFFARAHLLLLPSRADCTPMALAEAMAHGTPVLAANTGGVSEMVTTGPVPPGRVLPYSASSEIWAAEIQALTADPGTYLATSQAAFARSRISLNWSAWADRIAEIAGQAAMPDLSRAA